MMTVEGKIDDERKKQEKLIEKQREEQEHVANQEARLIREARQTIRYIHRHDLQSVEKAVHWFVNMCDHDLLNLVFVVRRSLRWMLLKHLYNLTPVPNPNQRTTLFWEYVKHDITHNAETRRSLLNLIIKRLHLSTDNIRIHETQDGGGKECAATISMNTLGMKSKNIHDAHKWNSKAILSLYTAMYKFNESTLYSIGRLERQHLYTQPIEYFRKRLDKLTGDDGEWWREFVTNLAQPIVEMLSRYCNWTFQDQMATYCMRTYPIWLLKHLFQNDRSGRSVFLRCCTAVRVHTANDTKERINAAYLDTHKTCIDPFLTKLATLLLPILYASPVDREEEQKYNEESRKISFNPYTTFSFIVYLNGKKHHPNAGK